MPVSMMAEEDAEEESEAEATAILVINCRHTKSRFRYTYYIHLNQGWEQSKFCKYNICNKESIPALTRYN